MKRVVQYKYWIVIASGSLLLAFLFSLPRVHSILTHSTLSDFSFIEYFGYGSKAFALSLAAFLVGFILLYYLIRAFIKGGVIRKAIIGAIIAPILLSPLYSHPGRVVNSIIPPIEPSLVSNETYYAVFTFDTEEDWDPNSNCYYDSYNYITSGTLYQLVDRLNERNVSATFYVAPNLASDMPEVLRYLENKGQTIGVHLRPHALLGVNYPYCDPFAQTKGNRIANYSYSEKKDLMKRAKEEIEAAVGHEVLLYRSGKFSCDYEIEEIARDLGFEAISNHKQIYFIDPVGIWNLDHGTCEILGSDSYDILEDYVALFESKVKHEHIITFAGHPMRLYNLNRNQFDRKQLDLFLQFIDYLSEQQGVEIINQYQLLELIKHSTYEILAR